VENECDVLRGLEGVPHVERCLGGPNRYPYEDGRVMIALSPVMTPTVSNDITPSLKDVNSGEAQRYAVKNVVETMVGMLAAGVYTIDVQPLFLVETGDVLFIDFTEASRFSRPPSPSEESAMVGFCSEMRVLIPDSLRDEAKDRLIAELDVLRTKEAFLPEKVVDILESVWID